MEAFLDKIYKYGTEGFFAMYLDKFQIIQGCDLEMYTRNKEIFGTKIPYNIYFILKRQQRYTNLLLSPPDWSDTYYDKKERQDKMSQIIDVPHFVDSKQVGLIQLADFMCFFLRKHIELQMDLVPVAYRGEKEKVADWTGLMLARAIPKNNIYLARGRCECSELFYRYAPDIIR